jgi:guanine deaminase
VSNVLLVTGARVYDHDGDVHLPRAADILAVDGRIAAVRPGIGDAIRSGAPVPELAGSSVGRILDASGRLVIPGFVNAHYHSHDVLLKGCFETIPLELWVLSALPPAFPKRSKAELRARTLLGAIECLRSGITTVQDMATVFPYDEEHVDTILQAYDDVGIRCVFALQVADVPGAKSIPFWEDVVPAEMRKDLSGAVEPFEGSKSLAETVRELTSSRMGRHRRITWAIGPSSPERCSEELLRAFAGMSEDLRIPVYTHIYESKAMTLIARQTHQRDRGSLIRFLDRCGLLGPRLNLAHSVWMLPEEIRLIAERQASVVLNPVGNLKTRSGVAPIRQYVDAGVNVALGCDNCSCSDCQNMFQSMKMFASLAAITDPEPGPPTAAQAFRAATVAGAIGAGMSGSLGRIEVGFAADFSIVDLNDPSFVPLNSAVRQLVFTEAGRSVETVVVDGRIVVEQRRIVSVDEAALYAEAAEYGKELLRDLEGIQGRLSRLMPYLLEAHRRTWAEDVGTNRYVGL